MTNEPQSDGTFHIRGISDWSATRITSGGAYDVESHCVAHLLAPGTQQILAHHIGLTERCPDAFDESAETPAWCVAFAHEPRRLMPRSLSETEREALCERIKETKSVSTSDLRPLSLPSACPE